MPNSSVMATSPGRLNPTSFGVGAAPHREDQLEPRPVRQGVGRSATRWTRKPPLGPPHRLGRKRISSQQLYNDITSSTSELFPSSSAASRVIFVRVLRAHGKLGGYAPRVKKVKDQLLRMLTKPRTTVIVGRGCNFREQQRLLCGHIHEGPTWTGSGA